MVFPGCCVPSSEFGGYQHAVEDGAEALARCKFLHVCCGAGLGSNDIQKNKRVLLHGDVFREYIFPEIASQPSRLKWDNLSEDTQPFATSVEACRENCDAQKDCVQFSFRDGTCYTSSKPRLGNPKPGSDSVSGWSPKRIRKMMENKGLCRKPDFG